MANDRRTFRPLSTIHLVLMLLLTGAWLLFLTEHTPARAYWETTSARRGRTYSSDSIGRSLRGSLGRARLVTRSLAGDLLFGSITIGLFWIGSRVYVRRFEIWLEARGSGAAMDLGGTELSADTIAANSDRGGILR
jgi:hypothetical protein